MFWRFGSDEDSRPVVVAAIANEVCTRLVSGLMKPGQRIGVGGFELGQLPPVDDLARQLVPGGSQILKRLG
jgi:hypothetical protein